MGGQREPRPRLFTLVIFVRHWIKEASRCLDLIAVFERKTVQIRVIALDISVDLPVAIWATHSSDSNKDVSKTIKIPSANTTLPYDILKNNRVVRESRKAETGIWPFIKGTRATRNGKSFWLASNERRSFRIRQVGCLKAPVVSLSFAARDSADCE